MFFVANSLHDWVMSQYWPYNYFLFTNCLGLRETITKMNDSETGYFVEFDLRYPLNFRKKTGIFLFCPQNKHIAVEKITEYMQKTEREIFTPHDKSQYD